MSTLYEQWQPTVGDRVRLVMRDETGRAADAGRTGTIVGVRPGEPNAMCEVEFDGGAGREHVPPSELVPIEAPARVVVTGEHEASAPSSAAGPAWRPSVGDRVMVAGLDRGGTISATEEGSGGITHCEVEFDHRPGEPERPQRRLYPIDELTPIKEPSAAVLEDDRR